MVSRAIPIADAQRLFDEIAIARLAGHKPPGQAVHKQRAALRVAGDVLGIPTGSQAAHYKAACRALGREFDWASPRVRVSAGDRTGATARPSIRRSWPPYDVPMSEDADKFREDWTAADCVAELRRVAALDPERALTRNYFRNNSDISESTWNRFFGSFLEYKRQAGIILSRHQHRLERSIAKHASVDAMRDMNIDKAGWEDAYLRPHGRRFQTVMVGTDIHDRRCDPFWRRLFIDTAGRVRPEKIVLNGDVFDLTEFGKYSVDPREWDVVGRIRWVHEFLGDLREASPDSEIIMIEGNHEFRLLRHLAEASPAMRVILSDLHGWTVSKLLGLDAFEVNYIARMDLGTFTERDIRGELRKNYAILYKCLLAHHFPEGIHMGYPGWNGHEHKHKVTPFYSPTFGSTQWVQIGCGSSRAVDWTAGEKWANGFLLVHVDTHSLHSAFENVDIREHAVIGGRFYLRDEVRDAA